MSDEKKQLSAASRILRERAMEQLRKTRAGIDPHFLAVMKEKFSAMMPGMADAAEKKPPAAPAAPAMPPSQPKAVYPANPIEPLTAPESEPVDREKIAQIVVEYMKRREEKSRH